MASLVWRGDCQSRAQVTTVVPSNIEAGDTLTLTINRKDISVVATVSDTATTFLGVANVVSLFVAAIGQYQNDIAEFAEISAAAATDDDGLSYLVLTGPIDGKPFTISKSTADAGSGNITIDTPVQGVAAVNEKQRVILGGTPTGGTFTLTFAGQTTGAIAYNASAATVTAALEALSNIAPGDVVTTENATSDWTIEFAATYAETNVPLMTGSGSSLTGGCGVSVTTTQNGGGVNEVQDVVVDHPSVMTSTGSFKLKFNGSSTISLAGNALTSTVQSALEALPTIGAGNVTVAYYYPGTNSVQTTYRVTFVGALGGADQNLMTFDLSAGDTGGISITTITGGTTQNEIQVFTLTGNPTGGTFTLTFQGQTTAGIAYNANAAAVVSALEALSNIAVGDVDVVQSGFQYTVTFQALLASTDVLQMTGSGASLTGGSVNISTTQEAVAGVNEVETVTIGTGVTGGTFALTFNSETTGAIAYNASAATVLAALEGLATPVPGDFTVTGSAGGPWTVTFTGTYAKTNVTEMTGDGGNLTSTGSQDLTLATPTTATGPNNLNDAENYSTGSLPVNGDTLIIDDPNAGDILWNLDALSAVTLAKLVVRQSFELKKIGLSDHNGLYYEYRTTELTIGATSIELGNGDGSGWVLLRINTGTVQTAIEQINSGQAQDSSQRATMWRGTHASNTAEILGGQFAAALDQADLATLLTFRVLASDEAGSAPDIFCGPGLTLGTAEVDGGKAILNSAIGTALTVNDGLVVLRGSGAVAQLNGLGGKVVYNTSGTLGGNTVLAGDCELDFSQDMSTKTITNPIEMESSECKVTDPNKVTSGLVMDFNYVNVEVNGMKLGRNRRITMGVPA